MSKSVLHLSQMIRRGDCTITTTLCRRVNNSKDDYNVADTAEQVTCKFCLKQMARNDKWKQWA